MRVFEAYFRNKVNVYYYEQGVIIGENKFLESNAYVYGGGGNQYHVSSVSSYNEHVYITELMARMEGGYDLPLTLKNSKLSFCVGQHVGIIREKQSGYLQKIYNLSSRREYTFYKISDFFDPKQEDVYWFIDSNNNFKKKYNQLQIRQLLVPFVILCTFFFLVVNLFSNFNWYKLFGYPLLFITLYNIFKGELKLVSDFENDIKLIIKKQFEDSFREV